MEDPPNKSSPIMSWTTQHGSRLIESEHWGYENTLSKRLLRVHTQFDLQIRLVLLPVYGASIKLL